MKGEECCVRGWRLRAEAACACGRGWARALRSSSGSIGRSARLALPRISPASGRQSTCLLGPGASLARIEGEAHAAWEGALGSPLL